MRQVSKKEHYTDVLLRNGGAFRVFLSKMSQNV